MAPSALFELHLKPVLHLLANSSYTQEDMVTEVDAKIRQEFKSIWLQSPDRWTFFGALFFCCTVFTTVGESTLICLNAPGVKLPPHVAQHGAGVVRGN